MEVIGAFLYTYLEYIFAGVGGVVFMGYMLSRKPKKYNDDVTSYIVEIKRLDDKLNKQTKSTF